LENIESVLRQNENALINVEGHTDSVGLGPFVREKYNSNRELSVYRVLNVADYIKEEFGISQDRIVVVGHADNRPVADNSTSEGREQNRRVEIYLIPDQAG